MKKVWTSLLLILSAAFLLTACADGGQQEEDTGAEGGLPGLFRMFLRICGN